MQYLLSLFLFLLSHFAEAQSILPSCPVAPTDSWNNCFGRATHLNGVKYVGEFRDGKRHGEGVFYLTDGTRGASGTWSQNVLVSEHYVINYQSTDANQKFERDRLSAEIEIERKRRQELEQQLISQVKERERLIAEARDSERRAAEDRNRLTSTNTPNNRPPSPAINRSERRIAMVIGNSAYKVSPLDNPANDAADIAEALKRTGFNTTLIRNATLAQIRDATRRFADMLPNSDVALIYFAGHGVESNRKNFMIPINADIKFEYELSEQAYDAGVWLDMLETIKSNNADRVNIVILDACRNNNLIASRGMSRGLGKMDAPSGTFLAYSTSPGKVAADGAKGERNSPFTKHLLRAMGQPGLPIEELFKEVRRNVTRETNGAQVPWESTSLTGNFNFR